MNRKNRLTATLQGNAVDRPAVSFYELTGSENTTDTDPYNIYNDPSWKPLIDLARDHSDRIVGVHIKWVDRRDPLADSMQTDRWEEDDSRYTRHTLSVAGHDFVRVQRQDRNVNTLWTLEHPLQNKADVEAYLSLPEPEDVGKPDVTRALELERKLGDSGIIMLDTPDPLCCAAEMFEMSDYMVFAMTEPDLFTRLLDRFARELWEKVRRVVDVLPGRLWRVYGPEYASEPYLPPHMFEQYVTHYDTPLVEAVQATGGYIRLHSHGRLKNILPYIAATGCDGIDPIEPEPQGDVSLRYVQERYGDRWVLFGNLEARDLVHLPTDAFRRKIETALREGTSQGGRGFVLLPSACPYYRTLPSQAMDNYKLMIDVANSFPHAS